MLQALIAITAAIAVYLILLPESDRRRRWGCIVGMAGQPGWLINAWSLETWGALVGALAFTVAYLSDFRRVWWPDIEVAWLTYIAKLRAEAEANYCYGSATRRHNWHHARDWNSGYYSDPRKGYSGDNIARAGLRCYECGEMRWDQSDEEWRQRNLKVVLEPKGARFDFVKDQVVLPPQRERCDLEATLSAELFDSQRLATAKGVKP